MFNEFGTPIGFESESMLPPGQNRLPDRMLAESGIEMNFLGAAIGIASFAGSMLSGQRAADNQQAAANRQAASDRAAFANSVAQNAYQTEFSKLMIAEQNKRTQEIYDIQVDQYREQIGLNSQAALASYAQEQRRLNEEFVHMQFRKQGMLRELMKIQGNQLAAGQGNTNRSLERANLINSLGNFGMEQVMLDENLRGQQSAYQQRLSGINAEWEHADRDAFSKIAIAPQLALPETGAGPQLQGPPGATRVRGPGIGGFFSSVATGLSAGAQIASLPGIGWSDAALKENIKHIGKSPSGINIFEYNYQGETTRHRGAMAQEVLVKKPEAVVEMDNGYLGINYNMIDVKPQVVSTT